MRSLRPGAWRYEDISQPGARFKLKIRLLSARRAFCFGGRDSSVFIVDREMARTGYRHSRVYMLRVDGRAEGKMAATNVSSTRRPDENVTTFMGNWTSTPSAARLIWLWRGRLVRRRLHFGYCHQLSELMLTYTARIECEGLRGFMRQIQSLGIMADVILSYIVSISTYS